MSKNGAMFRCDIDLRDFLVDIQKSRVESGLDKSPKNLTLISHLAWKVLRQQKNIDRMLKGRCK